VTILRWRFIRHRFAVGRRRLPVANIGACVSSSSMSFMSSKQTRPSIGFGRRHFFLQNSLHPRLHEWFWARIGFVIICSCFWASLFVHWFHFHDSTSPIPLWCCDCSIHMQCIGPLCSARGHREVCFCGFHGCTSVFFSGEDLDPIAFAMRRICKKWKKPPHDVICTPIAVLSSSEFVAVFALQILSTQGRDK
jgi:hypothetical protein